MMSLIDQYVSQAKDHVRGRKLRRQHQHGHLLVQTPAEPPAVDLSATANGSPSAKSRRLSLMAVPPWNKS